MVKALCRLSEHDNPIPPHHWLGKEIFVDGHAELQFFKLSTKILIQTLKLNFQFCDLSRSNLLKLYSIPKRTVD